MKICLVDPSHYVTNYGLRCLSSYLNEQGVDAEMLFLKPDESKAGFYSDSVYSDFKQAVSDCDAVGFSVFTNFFDQAARLSAFVKEAFPDKPLFWGGIHATVSPESSIEHADAVCIGEGEETVLDLAKRIEKGSSLEGIEGT